MNAYKELAFIRGNSTVRGIFDYLTLLENRLMNKLKSEDEDIFLFGESSDDSEKYSSYCSFSITDWLLMGDGFLEWLAYALSLELTNIYINSEEFNQKRERRRAWLKNLKLSNSDKIIEANAKDCLSTIKEKRGNLANFVNSLEADSIKAGYKSKREYFGHIMAVAGDRIRKNKSEEVSNIAERMATADSLIEQMYRETVQYFKENTIYWKELSEELRERVNSSECKYNIPFMEAFFELSKKSSSEVTNSEGLEEIDRTGKREAIPVEVRREVWRRDQGKCTKCDRRENLEYDRIIPLSKGGSNTVRNIELLCQDCNRRKYNKIG